MKRPRLKAIFSIIQADFTRSTRDSIIVYIVLSPILLSVLALVVLPTLPIPESLATVAQGYALIFILLTSLLLGGTTAGLLVVEERGQRIIQASAISPLRVSEYILAKSIFASLIPLVMGIVVSYIFFNAGEFAARSDTAIFLARYFLASLAIYPLGILLGLVLAYLAETQIAALGIVKLLLPVFLTIPIVSLVVAERFAPLFYIFPNYWAFKTLESLYLPEIGQFPSIALPAALSFLLGSLALAAFIPPFARRLALK